MKVYLNPIPTEWPDILKRPTIDTTHLENTVSDILREVEKNGDQAVRHFTDKFDKVNLTAFEVSSEEMEKAADQLDTSLKQAIRQAKQNIEVFHASQQEDSKKIETMPGVVCWRRSVGIEKVGLYIPGGTAPLFSTVLMLGVPAKLAGCRDIILCSPPDRKGRLHPAMLYAAQVAGINNVFKVGGVQAIAAMAYGTESIPAVYKIFGPGNQYVTKAKQLVNKAGVAIDMPAGPSEVLVYADAGAVPEFVAADLLSQAEHGEDSQVVLIATREAMVNEVIAQMEAQLKQLPRQEIATKALENSVAIVVDSNERALDLINFYAPEHLILATENAEILTEGIVNAGSIFLGHYTPESVGDYASGTNHTLPTSGFAKVYSGISLDSFVKKITIQELTFEGLKRIGPIVQEMAEAEQLQAHKNAVSIRLKNL